VDPLPHLWSDTNLDDSDRAFLDEKEEESDRSCVCEVAIYLTNEFIWEQLVIID
jgi:hypothetical protein